jgi:hypothetical protein
MKRSLYISSVIAFLLATSISALVWAEDRAAAKPAAQPANQAASKPRIPFTISKETTYIVQPLDKDGYPDYVEALNQHYGRGVTPENNAAVPFWRAIGPSHLGCPKERRGEFFKLLGIDLLPEKGDYFVTPYEFAERLVDPEQTGEKRYWDAPEYKSFFEAHWHARQRPWSKKEFPQLAAWLATNEKPLALFVEASNRPRRFDPLLNGMWTEKPDMLRQLSPFRYLPRYVDEDLRKFDDAVETLAIRAMLRLGDGKVDEAWNDLLACHRLARLAAEGPTFDEFVNAHRLEGVTWLAEQAMLQNAHLSASQIRQMMGDLNRLRSIPDVVEKIDIGVRCEYLQTACWMSRNQLTSGVDRAAITSKQKALLKSLALEISERTSWDVLFRKGNVEIDRLIDSIRHSTPAQREALQQEMSRRNQRALTRAKQDLALARKSLEQAPPNADLGTVLRTALEGRKNPLDEFADFLCFNVLQSSYRAREIEDGIHMRFELTKLAFALAAYRADRGEFPSRLADLAPRYAARIPKDVFSDADLHYTSGNGGYLLYSVGPNRQDDGGKGIGDRPEDRSQSWDDITVRMSAPK